MKKWVESKGVIHKVPCRKCGWYNDPLKLHKSRKEKYYRCFKCGAEIKSEKEEFIDNMLFIMKGDRR